MSIIVHSTANAGIVLDFSGKRFWIDALHDRNTSHYSIVTPEMRERMYEDPALNHPDYLLYTHAHSDHFSRQLAIEAMAKYPDAQLVIEGNKGIDRQIRLRNAVETLELGNVRLECFRLTHAGKGLEGCRNYALYLEADGQSVLAPGDCRVACPELLEWIENREKAGKPPIDLLCLNFPWLALGAGRDAVDLIGAKHALFFHMPFPEDDVFGYGKQVGKILEKTRGDRDWRLVTKPFQREEF